MQKIKLENGLQVNNQKTAVVWGSNGQDGSYLCELLLGKGYKVIGVIRRSSVNTTERLRGYTMSHPAFKLTEGDVTDLASVSGIISEHLPDECYNLAAQSHVGTSFKQPVATFQVNAVGVLNLLEAIRVHSPETRFYQANTSEMWGNNYDEEVLSVKTRRKSPQYSVDGGVTWVDELPQSPRKYQDEHTEFAPRSPYAVAKMAAHNLVHTYRESYGLHASAGILHNHESERRGEEFVTRKITKWIGEFVAKYKTDTHISLPASLPDEEKLALGNLDAYRDWGHAQDYVYAMYLMLQQEKPDDYVIATGEAHSVRDFLDVAFKHIGVDDWSNYVRIDPTFFRPAEVDYLCGRADKAEEILDWMPSISFTDLVHRMVEHDTKAAFKRVADPFSELARP